MSDEAKLNVKEACKKFLLKSDELLASKLQYDEHVQRYQQNKQLHHANRVNIQESLPVAKFIQTTEYRQLVESDQLRARHLTEIEENDKLIAMRLQEEYLKESRRDEMIDVELASRLQQEEIFHSKYDEQLAYELQEEERKAYEEMKSNKIVVGARNNKSNTIQPTSTSQCLPGVPVKLEASNFSSQLSTEANKSKLIINLKFDSLSTSSLSESESESFDTRPTTSTGRSKSIGNLSKVYESIGSPEKHEIMMSHKLTGRNVRNFEKESLIDSSSASTYSSQHNEKCEFSCLPTTAATNDSGVEKEAFVSQLIGNVKKSNIVAAIDPTFNKYKISYQEAPECEIKTTKSKKESKKKSNFNSNTSSSFYDNDTDTFLPVQGHKRSSFKSTLSSSKKKSQSTCLQQ